MLIIHDMLDRARCQTRHEHQLPWLNQNLRLADGKTAEARDGHDPPV